MSEKPEALRLVNVSAVLKDLRRLHAENERLREALTYDWDQLEACRESLREHMVEIKRLREALNRFEYSSDGHIKRYPEEEEVIAALRREGT